MGRLCTLGSESNSLSLCERDDRHTLLGETPTPNARCDSAKELMHRCTLDDNTAKTKKQKNWKMTYGGLSHFRFLTWTPTPHGYVHSLHGLNLLHSPFCLSTPMYEHMPCMHHCGNNSLASVTSLE